ncbi:uncharacterized protein DEA37_0010104 [Paragonimus westermani]|uniref:Reverse transcriptase domain-containing protein n=1 Tax=Paragonimus westermani TaxID=34504 RepID=A0A5J4NG40_9TREM|nr:uncharacterized protein DEA37_0010104 [Paragonimus westermani]
MDGRTNITKVGFHDVLVDPLKQAEHSELIILAGDLNVQFGLLSPEEKRLGGGPFETVFAFIYLGSIISLACNNAVGVSARMARTQVASANLRDMWHRNYVWFLPKGNTSRMRMLLFADDSALLAHSEEELQRLATAFASAASKFGLDINTANQVANQHWPAGQKGPTGTPPGLISSGLHWICGVLVELQLACAAPIAVMAKRRRPLASIPVLSGEFDVLSSNPSPMMMMAMPSSSPVPGATLINGGLPAGVMMANSTPAPPPYHHQSGSLAGCRSMGPSSFFSPSGMPPVTITTSVHMNTAPTICAPPHDGSGMSVGVLTNERTYLNMPVEPMQAVTGGKSAQPGTTKPAARPKRTRANKASVVATTTAIVMFLARKPWKCVVCLSVYIYQVDRQFVGRVSPRDTGSADSAVRAYMLTCLWALDPRGVAAVLRSNAFQLGRRVLPHGA